MKPPSSKLVPTDRADGEVPRLRERFGMCQWFHYEDHRTLEHAVHLLRELGIRHLRTGISWADFLRPGGQAWYDVMMSALADFDVLLSVWHTPPSLSEGGTCASPPRRLRDYADFIDVVITRYGRWFSHLELWNEPNNRWKWDYVRFDLEWRKFGEMAGTAAYWAHQRGVRTVLGGIIPVDPAWLGLMERWGALPHFDVIAIHGFPGMWWDDAPNWEWFRDWKGWPDKVDLVRPTAAGRPVWVTETGFATLARETAGEAHLPLQVQMLVDAATLCPAERLYWYSLIDLDPAREAIEGFHVDENEYHLGLVRADGSRKPAFDVLQDLLRQPDPMPPALVARP